MPGLMPRPGMMGMPPPPGGIPRPPLGVGPPPGGPPPASGADLDSLLSRKSTRDRMKTEKCAACLLSCSLWACEPIRESLMAPYRPSRGEELLDLIQKPTAKEAATVKKFKTEGGPAVREYCPHLTKDDCCRRDTVPQFLQYRRGTER